MKITFRIVSTILLFVSTNLLAQDDKSQRTRMAQVTFAYPIGSNGMDSPDYSNNFSFNILYGLNGGLKGLEIGSILNINRGQVSGIQISGVANYNTGYTHGFILSGMSNICLDSTNGLFISGLLNYTKQSSKGFQVATANIANDFEGFQLGVFNYSGKLKGVQLGVINIMKDGTTGLPIGIFSVVKNGYFELELTGGEVIYSNLTYKMGVEKLYSIYKAGFSAYKGNPVYSFGFGFGSGISISDNHKLNFDLTSNNVVYDNDWDSDLNLLNKFDMNYRFFVSEKLSLLIGPSVNVYLTDKRVDNEFGTLNIPYTVYTSELSSGKLSMWFGLNAGLALRL